MSDKVTWTIYNHYETHETCMQHLYFFYSLKHKQKNDSKMKRHIPHDWGRAVYYYAYSVKQ